MSMAQKITLSVTKKEQIAPDIYEVTFRLVNPPEIVFTAGQNMMLMIAPGINRTMSIASPPSSKSEILMLHDVSPMGPGSKWTLGLAVGDSGTIVAPTGGVLSLMDTPRRKVLIATGTGIAPFRSVLLDRLAGTDSSGHMKATGEQTQIVLYWGLRYGTDRYWSEELDRIADHNVSFTWHQVLSKPPADWQGLTGHVTEHVLAKEKDMEKSEFYVCGNKAMTEEVRAKLLERNVPKEQIKTELFF